MKLPAKALLIIRAHDFPRQKMRFSAAGFCIFSGVPRCGLIVLGSQGAGKRERYQMHQMLGGRAGWPPCITRVGDSGTTRAPGIDAAGWEGSENAEEAGRESRHRDQGWLFTNTCRSYDTTEIVRPPSQLLYSNTLFT